MVRKSGLGKGLDALIPGDQQAVPEGSSLYLSIDQIQPNPYQPRLTIADSDLQELASSIQEHGILQPLIVSPGAQMDQYILVAGERRLRAARLAGLQTVPVILRTVDEKQQLELALIENIQRADLSPLETAEAYRQLANEFSLSHDEIAHQVGKSRSAITNTLRLLDLTEDGRSALAGGKISEGHARAILGLTTPKAQNAALETVLKLELNVRQTEELVRKLNGKRPEKPVSTMVPPEISDLASRLGDRMGTKVTLRHGKRGGTVTIHYYSDEELDAIIAQILKD